MKPDYLYGTSYTLIQGEHMFHFNSDTELLGSFMHVYKKDTVLDIGTNNGALLLYAASKGAASLCGIDLFDNIIHLAQMNLQLNHLDAEMHAVRLQEFSHDSFDLIVCNPPYFDTKTDHLKNENLYLRAARHTDFLPLDDLFFYTSKLLKPNGSFCLVYRPDCLNTILHTASSNNLYPDRMRIAYASKNKPAKTILLSFCKRKNIHLQIEPPAYLDDRDSIWKKGEYA